MCLTKTHPHPLTSGKEIEVYKIFLKEMFNNELFLVTPYVRCLAAEGEEILAKYPVTTETSLGKCILGEGVHAYQTLEAAKLAKEDFDSWFPTDGDNPYVKSVIHKAIIPPHTRYWLGKYDEIAATRILIKEEISLM